MKICVTGAQCVGKTTFIDDLITEFPEFSRPEYTYRDAIKEAGIENKINQETCKDSQKLVFEAICEATRQAADNTIHDRSAIDAVAYTIWPTRYRKGETDISAQFAGAMKRTATIQMDELDLIIYIPIDEEIELVEDNLRDTDPEYRRQMAEIFEELILVPFDDERFGKYGYKVATISGSREERVAQFKEIIKQLSN